MTSGYWRPSSKGKTVERDVVDDGVTTVFNKNRHLSLDQQRKLLPIFKFKDSILFMMEKYNVIVLIGETGCGKSTQIPQYLLEAGWASGGRSIVCTQPRKVAVLTVAERVASEVGCSLGQQVGYGLRFDYRCSSETQIRFYTDGVLLRETLVDPLLSKYDVIMVDEAHCRSLQSDLLLGLLKKLRKHRPDLRIIITSATMDALEMRSFFRDDSQEETVGILSVSGQSHSVDVLYLQSPCRNYLLQTVQTIVDIHTREDLPGDVLVFLPGLEEINIILRLLQNRIDDEINKQPHSKNNRQASLENLYCLPLHGSLSHHMQLQALQKAPVGKRKVVLATNVAETSLTIDGLRFVIDSCLVRLPFHDVTSGLTILHTVVESNQMAQQRAGRAGRTSSGKCFRLVTENDFETLISQPSSAGTANVAVEMSRCDITSAVLTLKALGVSDILHFDFLTAPSVAALLFALEQLYALGALDETGQLTLRGAAMAELPLEPRWAASVLSSRESRFAVQEEMLSLAAMCALESPFVVPFSSTGQTASSMSRKREDKERQEKNRDSFVSLGSDHVTLLNVFQQFRDQLGRQHGHTGSENLQAWCDEHCVSHRVMCRAVELRATLAAALRRCAVYSSEKRPHSTDSQDKTDTEEFTVEQRLKRCLVTGFFAHCARLMPNGRYLSLRGATTLLPLPATSVLANFGTFPEWIIFGEVTSTHRQSETAGHEATTADVVWVRDASAIDPLWLAELARHYYDLKF